MKLNLFHKSLISTVGVGALGILNLGSSVLLARGLGADGVGQYQTLISAATILGALGTFGVGGANIYFIKNQGDGRQEVGTSCLKFSLLMAATIMPLAALIFSQSWYFGVMSWAAVGWATAYVALLLVVSSMGPLLTIDLEVVKYQVVALMPKLVLLLLVGISIVLGSLTVEAAWAFSTTGIFTAVLVALFFVRRFITLRQPWHGSLVKRLVRYGMRLNLSYVILLLNGEASILMLRGFLHEDFTEVGYYSRAVRLGGLILMFSGAIGPLLYSQWSGLPLDQRRTQLEQVSRVLSCIFVVGAVFLFLMARPLIIFLFTEEFLPAVTILQLVIGGVVFRAVCQPHFRLFSSSGKPLYTSWVLSVNLLAMVVMGVILIPALKGVGAAIMFSAANFAGLALTLYLSRRNFGVNPVACLLPCWDDVKYVVRAVRLRTG